MSDGRSDFAERQAQLKRLKVEDRKEKARILAQLEEDRKEREHRQQQAALAKQAEAEASASLAGQSSDNDAPMAVLSIRTDEGAVRHSFPADATLLDVRAWLAEHRRAAKAAIPKPTAHTGVGPGRVLINNEMAEAARAGREFFEQQTARLREEARAMREAGAVEPPIYFVSPMPRQDFLDEAAMGQTLRDVGLVPRGTLMARCPLVAPVEDSADEGPQQESEGEGLGGEDDGESGCVGEGEGEEGEEGDSESFDEADEGGENFPGFGGAGMPPGRGAVRGAGVFGATAAPGAGHVLGGSKVGAVGAEGVATPPSDRRAAALAAAMARSGGGGSHPGGGLHPDSSTVATAPGPAHDGPGIARREAALAAAVARSSQGGASAATAVGSAEQGPVSAASASSLPRAGPGAGQTERPAGSDERAARSLQAAQARAPPPAAAPGAGSSAGGGRPKGKESMAARLARAVPALAASPPSAEGNEAFGANERRERYRRDHSESPRSSWRIAEIIGTPARGA